MAKLITKEYIKSDNTTLSVNIENDTVWLAQKQLAELFNCGIDNISLHIKNIFKEDELEEKSVTEEISITATDGKIYKVKHYNLDMIISLGFRVNSKEAVKFRKWANAVIKELLTNGKVDITDTKEWQLVREQGKLTRRYETDVIKQFVNYATMQGSTNASRYYSNITKMTNKLIGITSGQRDNLTKEQLSKLRFVESMVEVALPSLMASGLDYHDIFEVLKIKCNDIFDIASIVIVH